MALPVPVTRKDFLLAAAAGQSASCPEPVSREERYWAAIVQRMDSMLAQLAQLSDLKDNGSSMNEDMLTEMRSSLLDAFNQQMYWTIYGSLSGFLLIYQGRALNKVTTDAAYAGMTAQLTIISALGESTVSVEIGADGEIPIASFANVKTGFNLIFCETDTTQKDGDKLVGPTAVPLSAIYLRSESDFADMSFSQFLTAHHLHLDYVLAEPRPTGLDPNRKYFIRFYEEFQPIWDALDTTDGYYFVGIDTLSDALDEDIYTLEILRTRE